MSHQKSRFLCIGLVLLGFTANLKAMPAGSRITLPSGKSIFVSGMNLAWKNFAGDVGDTPLNESYFNTAMKQVADSGGNCMRVWLSTNGTNDPKYGSNGLVSGPGSQTINNIKKMLKIAQDNNILLMPVLLTHNWVEKSINPTILSNNIKMLTTESGLQAYIDNYLKPVVTAIGNHPNLLCWEVYNEPEGMVDGWSSPKNTITKEQVQKSVNWIAAAIKEIEPTVLVSNGAATIGTIDWYKDAALKNVGGKEKGVLDFYMAHYYGWNGTGNSPFTKSYASWNLDKPLVIGEYASSDWSQSTNSTNPMQDAGKVDTLLKYLDKAGYAGGLGWQYQQDGGDPWMKGFSTFSHSIAELFRFDSNSVKLDGSASSTFAVIASAGNGGTVSSSVAGRINAGESVTLTATASSGYTFLGWTGDTTCAEPVLLIQNVKKDWIVQANFKPGEGTNLIKDGDFSSNTNWIFYPAPGNTADVKFTSEQANVTITKQDDTTYHIQLSQRGLPIDSGSTYIVAFDAWSTGERTLNVGMTIYPTWQFQDAKDVSLTDQKQNFTVELKCITKLADTTSGELQFNLGGSSLPVYIDNVTFVKKSTSTIWDNKTLAKSNVALFRRTGDMIFWNLPSEQGKVSLMDISGRFIQPQVIGNSIRINHIPEGMYILMIKDGVNHQIFKFVR